MARAEDSLSSEDKIWTILHDHSKQITTLQVADANKMLQIKQLQNSYNDSNRVLINRQERHEEKTDRTSEQLTLALLELKGEFQKLIVAAETTLVTLKYSAVFISIIISAGWAAYTFYKH